MLNHQRLLFVGFNKVGGLTKLVDLYMNATPSVRNENSTCGLPRDDAFAIFRGPVTSDLPWPGVIFHITFGAVWYFSCEQVSLNLYIKSSVFYS